MEIVSSILSTLFLKSRNNTSAGCAFVSIVFSFKNKQTNKNIKYYVERVSSREDDRRPIGALKIAAHFVFGPPHSSVTIQSWKKDCNRRREKGKPRRTKWRMTEFRHQDLCTFIFCFVLPWPLSFIVFDLWSLSALLFSDRDKKACALSTENIRACFLLQLCCNVNKNGSKRKRHKSITRRYLKGAQGIESAQRNRRCQKAHAKCSRRGGLASKALD